MYVHVYVSKIYVATSYYYYYFIIYSVYGYKCFGGGGHTQVAELQLEIIIVSFISFRFLVCSNKVVCMGTDPVAAS